MRSAHIPPAPNASELEKGRRRSGRAQRAAISDPYRWAGKPKEPAICPHCYAVFHRGRWTWQSPPPKTAAETLCPACHRIKDKSPAGLVSLSGSFVAGHMGDLIMLAHTQADAEAKEHPLNRVIAITPTAADHLEISTTDIHLPRRIGTALVRAYDGVLEERHDEDGAFIRVAWRRD